MKVKNFLGVSEDSDKVYYNANFKAKEENIEAY